MMPLRFIVLEGWSREAGCGFAAQSELGGPSAAIGRRLGVVERDPFLVLLARHRFDPLAMVEIPAHRAREARFERLARRPPELAAKLRRIDRVAPIVTGAV